MLTAVTEGQIDNKKRYANGDTIRQLLARSRYLLFAFETQWTDSQKERSKILFSLFPEIEKAYRDICAFRSFYNVNIGNTEKAKQSLFHWYKRMNTSQIPELKTFLHTVKNNQASILEYFYEGHTNAFAESLNAKIQRFVASNFGIHNRDFFHFRLNKIFS